MSAASSFGVPVVESRFLPPGSWMLVSDGQIVCSSDTWRRMRYLYGDAWEQFSGTLRRLTQKRLHYCSHGEVNDERLVCLGCNHTAQEIVNGLA